MRPTNATAGLQPKIGEFHDNHADHRKRQSKHLMIGPFGGKTPPEVVGRVPADCKSGFRAPFKRIAVVEPA
jgi:hypothetical protein